jgi:hypothetical protein
LKFTFGVVLRRIFMKIKNQAMESKKQKWLN